MTYARKRYAIELQRGKAHVLRLMASRAGTDPARTDIPPPHSTRRNSLTYHNTYFLFVQFLMFAFCLWRFRNAQVMIEGLRRVRMARGARQIANRS